MYGRFQRGSLALGHPLRRFGAELVDGHAGQRGHEKLLEVRLRQLGDGLAIAGEHRLERLLIFASSGLALTSAGTLSRHVDDLAVHRMLDPERAVLVEGGDPLRRRHEIGARLARWSLRRTRRSPAWRRRRSTTAADRSAPTPVR